MDKVVETLGITSLSKSQASVMAKELDIAVEAFRTRAAGCRPVHVHGRRRPGPQGPRRWSGGQRARPDRHRGQCREGKTAMFRPQKVEVTRYRYRGTKINAPWTARLTDITAEPFAMWPVFPTSDYYEGSVPHPAVAAG
jgi:hypothetical protein